MVLRGNHWPDGGDGAVVVVLRGTWCPAGGEPSGALTGLLEEMELWWSSGALAGLEDGEQVQGFKDGEQVRDLEEDGEQWQDLEDDKQLQDL